MASIVYESTALASINKKGKLRCDPDGYYDVVLGAFNAFNSGGAYYPLENAPGQYKHQEALSHFNPSHEFQRRIANGALYGEKGHPKFVPGMTKNQWISRILDIDEKNYSHHFKSVELETGDTAYKNKQDGSPMITVYGRIKPMDQQFADSLENPHENTAFSIRSLTRDNYCPIRRCVVKSMAEIVTFDRVTEPGIYSATKYGTPSLESLSSTDFTDSDINAAIAETRRMMHMGVGMEASNRLALLERLRAAPPQFRARELPASARWV